MSARLRVDAVDKVGDEQRAGNNRIQVPSFLNQCCAPDSDLESMLLTRVSKDVFRQHRSLAEVVNQCCAPDLESMLLTRASKNVFRQHRPKDGVIGQPTCR
jgi:hypothetical protein